jgi:hypothetical protein
VLRQRTRPAVNRFAPTRAALLALLLLAAVPAAAQGKNFKVDGRVTGPPTVKGGAVTAPLQLTNRTARGLNLGTRRVNVRLSRRARLPLSGSGASASRLAPSGLQAGDRLTGVTSLSGKARRRMRWQARPTLKLKRGRVTRRAPRGPSSLATPPVPRTPEQIVSDLAARVASLTLRAGELGALPQQIEARKLQLESLGTGLEGVTTSFESLTSALEAREGTVDQFALDALLASIEALVLRVEALESGTDAVETALGTLESALSTIGSALQELAPTAAIIGTQIELIKQFPGALAQVTALDEALRRIESRLGAAEAALGSLGSATDGLNGSMASLVNAVNALAGSAATADLASVSAGVNGLAGNVASLESGFGGLQTTMAGVAPAAIGLEGDALALEGMVEVLCTTLPTVCP